MFFLRYRYIGGSKTKSANKAGKAKNKNSNNQSVVKAAAYRTGEKLTREKTGEIIDYGRKGGILHTELMGFANAPAWVKNRSQVWNKIEAVETKANNRQAREIVLALPWEFDTETHKQLVRDFVSQNLTSRGMIADVAIHAPDKGGDPRNFHSHILLTTRTIDRQTGEFSDNKYGGRPWNNKALHDAWKVEWANAVNQEYLKQGFDKQIDPRSYQEQGTGKLPQRHEGRQATNSRRRKGEVSINGDYNDLVREINQLSDAIKEMDDSGEWKTNSTARAKYERTLTKAKEKLEQLQVFKEEEQRFFEEKKPNPPKPDKPDKEDTTEQDISLGQSKRSSQPTTGEELGSDAVEKTDLPSPWEIRRKARAYLRAGLSSSEISARLINQMDDSPETRALIKKVVEHDARLQKQQEKKTQTQQQKPRSDRPSDEQEAIALARKAAKRKTNVEQVKNPVTVYRLKLAEISKTSSTESIAKSYKNLDDKALECDRIIYQYMRARGFNHEQIRKAMRQASPATYRKSKAQADKYARRFNEWAKKQRQIEEKKRQEKQRMKRRL